MEMAQHLPSELSSLTISKTIESGYDEPLNGLDAEVLTDPDNQATFPSVHSSDLSDASFPRVADIVTQYNGTFEGPEKSLEVCFRPGVGHHLGCRALTRQQLDAICNQAQCTILSKVSNDHLDAYVLSESSLFVYKYKVVIKTCGTTTLLRCISCLLKYASTGLSMELEWVGYSRKNYTFPGEQYYPHSNFDQELQYLDDHKGLRERLAGVGYILGPISRDHWFVYVADKCDRPEYTATDRTVNIMMFDLDPDMTRTFWCDKPEDNIDASKPDCGDDGWPIGVDNINVARRMRKEAGISELVPGSLIDERAFYPCGYSMNLILFDSYYTIHVTPEEGCSYASFETNNPYKSYASMLNNILRIFKPGRFVLTMMADQAGLVTLIDDPFDVKEVSIPGLGGYCRTSQCSTRVEGDYCCLMANFDLSVKVCVLCISYFELNSQQHSHVMVI
eukprot:97794_1